MRATEGGVKLFACRYEAVRERARGDEEHHTPADE